MRSRPWPILFLALLNLLSPLYNVVISAWFSHIPVSTYLHLLFTQSRWYEVAVFLLAQPIAGFAIYMMQLWSYPLFILMTALTALVNFLSWKENPGAFSTGLLLSSLLVNILLVGYFLLPEVRLLYFNRKLRWWEAKPRYILDLPAKVVVHETDQRPAVIRNISEGGAFLEVPGRLSSRRELRLEYGFMGRLYQVRARAVHRKRGQKGGYGLQFVHDADTLEYMQRFARALDLLGCASNRNPAPVKASFLEWISGLVRSGRGWVPEIESGAGERSKPGQR